MKRKIGLIAGWGQYPITVARRLNEQGNEVFCLGIVGHADPELKKICHEFREIGCARISGQMRYFRRRGIDCATMAGKVFKRIIFSRTAWIRHTPDLGFLRYFYPHFLTKSVDRKDDTLLGMFVQAYAEHGILLAPATDFAPELLVKNRTLSNRTLSASQWKDVQFGWEIAKQMGDLDIGQSVAVKGRAVLAIEAVEGTDECIRRAGSLCPAGGFSLVKVAKPNQDMRFDVPTIGLGTLQTLRQAGGRVLVVEAHKTILLDEKEVIDYANRHRIALVAIEQSELQSRAVA
jgi:DUF1009 family protein